MSPINLDPKFIRTIELFVPNHLKIVPGAGDSINREVEDETSP